MGQQRVSNIALIKIEREYANSVVNNDIDRTIDIFGRQNGRHDMIYICYSPAGRSVLGKTVPEVLDTARGRRPRAVLKTEGTVFPNTDRPRLVNNIFIFFLNRTKGVRKT